MASIKFPSSRLFYGNYFSGLSFHALSFLLIFLVLALITIPVFSISNSSEAREVLVSRTISEGGEVLFPLRNGEVASKPPLLHWIVAASSWIFQVEVDVFLQRFISSIFAVAILCLVVNSPRFFLKDYNSKQIGLVAAGILALTPGFFRLALDARVDMCFAFFVVAAILSALNPLWTGFTYKQLYSYHFLAFWVCSGLAILTKGPLGFVLPLVIVFSIYITEFGIVDTFKIFFRPRIGWILLILLGPLWYISGVISVGEPFITRHLFENIERVKGGQLFHHQEWWYYLKIWPATIAPWFLLLPLVFYRSSKYLKVKRHLLIWVVAGTLLLSISSGKRGSYLLPLIPAVALYLSLTCCNAFYSLSGDIKLKIYEFRSVPYYFVFFVLLSLLAIISVLYTGSLFNSEFITATQIYLSKNIVYLLLAITLSLIFLLLAAKIFNDSLDFVSSSLFASIIITTFTINSFAEGLRAEFKGYDGCAKNINEISKDQKLVIIKEWYDELFDTIIVSLLVPYKVVSPKIVKCNKGQFYLSRKLPELLLQFNGVEILEHKTLSDKQKGRTDRDIILWQAMECSAANM